MIGSFTIAEGRKVLAAILARKLTITHGDHGRYVGRNGSQRIEWEMFQPGPQRNIAKIATAAAEVEALHVLHHGAIVAIAERFDGVDVVAIRAELNAIDPFRWPRGNGKLGREVK